MGLSNIEIGFLHRALLSGAIQPCNDILEFGESAAVKNAQPLLDTLADAIPDDRTQDARNAIAEAQKSATLYRKAFGPARALYHAIFGPHSYQAVDLALGPGRVCADLNRPFHMGREFCATINNGTSEHVFDQANVLRALHEHTRVGGIMIHWTTCVGFVDHGFYNAQPGLYFDLAAANGYEIRHLELAGRSDHYILREREDHRIALHEFPSLRDSLICAVLSKQSDKPFIPPMQGVWAGGWPIYLAHLVRDRGGAESRRNYALNRPARQSSTCVWSRHDDPAVDAKGGNNGLITGFYGFHTEQEENPWWEVDLGAAISVSEIVVYNRVDAPGVAARAMRLLISASDDGQIWRPLYKRTAPTLFGGADGNPLRISFKDGFARFIRLSLPGKAILHLDEVEIY
jgi:hypothetical protein